MSRSSIPEILERVEEFGKISERATYLQKNDHPTIRLFLRYMFDPSLKFDLPEGRPPFKHHIFDQSNVLWTEVRRFYVFTKTGHPTLSDRKREKLFIDLLECLCEKEVVALLGVKDQISPWPKLTRRVINKAFPGLLNVQDSDD